MKMTVRSKLIKIGNSRGIRIPQSLLEQVGLSGEVELQVEGDKLIIHPVNQPRQGWQMQFALMAEQGDDRLLDEILLTQWDEEEWVW